MQNTLEALNNALFAEIENLQDEENSDPERLEVVIKRTTAVSKIAETIIRNGELALKTMQHLNEYGYRSNPGPDLAPIPAMLESGK